MGDLSSILRRAFIPIFILLLIACVASIVIMLREVAMRHVEDEARALLTTALAVRSYTVKNVYPSLVQIEDDIFRPETVPSFAAQSVFAEASKNNSTYTYREAALNPTNPNDRATAFETELILQFRKDETLLELSGTRTVGNKAVFYLTQPVRIKDEACLACHSTPEVAPASMLKTYGAANGFGWELDEIIGIQILTVPMTREIQTTLRFAVLIVVTSIVLFFIFYLTVSVALQKYMVRPLKVLANAAERASLHDTSEPLPNGGSMEIQKLSHAIERLRKSLRLSIKQSDRTSGGSTP